MEEDEILIRLDLIAKLLALNITQEEKTKIDKVNKLNKLGLENKDIACVIGIETWRVNQWLKKIEKQKKENNG